MRLSFSIFLMFTFISLALYAESPPAKRLPKMVVRATALSTPSPLGSTNVTRMTAQELEQQQSVALVDALNQLPGVYVSQNGGLGQLAGVSIRGANTEHTCVVMDGVRLNDVSAINGAVDLAPWLVDDVAEIKVIRGPLSGLYGSDAIGGVIDIKTKRGKGPLKSAMKAEAGSFSTYQQALGIQGQKDRVDFSVTASRLQSAGSPVTPDRLRSSLQGKVDDPLHQENFSARIGAGQESAHLSFLTRYVSRRSSFRGRNRLTPWRQDLEETFHRIQGHVEGPEGKWIHEVGIAYYESDRENEDPSGQKDGENKGSQAQLDWRQTLDLTERAQVQIATELVQERFYTHRLGSSANQAQTMHGGAGAVLTMRVAAPLTLSVAARFDKYQGIPNVVTYRLGGEYSLNETIFKGGLGTGFKAPTLAQRFYRSPSFSGNPNLKPERSLGWDFGVERGFFQNRLTLGMTLFQNRIQDLIAWLGPTPSNQKKARTQGMEGILRFQITPEWGVNFTHTFTQSWDEQTGLKLLRRPQHKSTVRITGQITPEWQFSTHLLYVGRREDIDFQEYTKRIQSASYTVVGAETSYQLNGHWQIYGRTENLLNHRYENPSGYQQPGFGLYAGVRAKW